MITSIRGIDMLKALEGSIVMGGRHVVYKDVAGLDTIGYGHLLTPEEKGLYPTGIIESQATDLLCNDLEISERAIRNALQESQTQPQFDALVILVYNIGIGAFKKSSLLKIIKGDTVTAYKTLKDAWLAWSKAGGKVVEGLKKRREKEYKLYSTGQYS
jgi:lysozyme